ncbi:hypothetical protein ACFL3V_03180 [Nanoarchaeota archaeon]
MRRTINLIFLFIITILFSQAVYAIGISPADVYVNFVPNHEYIIDYTITSYRPFEFYTQGAFSEYTWVETVSHSDKTGKFRVHLKLPEEYDKPGKHRMYVAAQESPVRGVVNALAIIRGFIEIDVPFPGHYADVAVNVNNVNAGEPVYISVAVSNRGKLNISDARLQLTVLNGAQIVKIINSERFAINTTKTHVFEADIKGGELRPGRYTLRAELFYEGKPKKEDVEFKIGTFDIDIVNHTHTMFNNSVNPFFIEIESLWNNRMETVYMDLTIKDGTKALSTVKTPPFDLNPWENKRSEFYWNTKDVPVGEYDLEIVLHYDESVKRENRKIYIVEEQLPVQELPISASTAVLVTIAIMLILFNIYFFLSKKKKKEEEKAKR